MKSIPALFLLVILLFACTTYSFSQNSRKLIVPEAVKTTFTTMYPDVTVQEWEYNKKKKWYVAEFLQTDIQYESIFSADGEWIRTEKDIREADVPATVLASIAGKYPGWKIDGAEEYQTTEHNIVYVIDIEQGRKEMELYLLPGGQLISVNKK